MKTRHQLRKGRSFEHLRALFGDVSAGTGGTPTPPIVDFCELFTDVITGDLMAGMLVTATFADASTETLTWAATGAGAGGVTGVLKNWSLSEGGDTQSSNWTLSNTSGQGITQVVIQAHPAQIVFNTTLGGGKTPGSGVGQTFSKTGGNSVATIVATYSGLVAIPSHAAVGDLFDNLTIAFTSGGGLLNNTQITFVADTDGCVLTGAFGPVNPAVLIWHVECEFNCWASLAPNVQATGGQAVVRWDDLTGNSNNLTPLHVGGGGQVTNFQTGATSTGRPNIQCGSDWRAIFEGSFNFFKGNKQFTYAIFYRQASTHIALFDDGTPATNGIALGYGVGNLDSTGSGSTMMGIKDGATPTEDTLRPRLIISAFVVTYDGQNGGKTDYYLCRPAVPGPGFTYDHDGPFSNVGLNASGGFALGGTFNNADPNRLDTSLSLCEAAIWSGILTLAQIQDLADRGGNYWGYT